MENICRICESNNNLINLTVDTISGNIIKKLVNFANVSYTSDDPLPKFVCQKCTKDLDFSIEFKKKCESTDQKLRNALKWIKTSSESSTFFGTNIADLSEYIKTEKDLDIINEDSPNDVNFFTAQNKVKIEGYCDDESSANSNIFGNDNSEDNFISVHDGLTNNSSNRTKVQTTNRKISKVPTSRNLTKTDYEKSFECFICKKECKLKRSLRLHFTQMHEDNQFKLNREFRKGQTFECYVCKRVSKQKNSLKKHISQMHGIKQVRKPVECSICSNKFSTNNNLKRHISNIHEGIKLHQCNICAKSFAQKRALNEHLVTHSDERPFQCHLCSYTSKFMNNLRTHMRNHDPNNPKKKIPYNYRKYSKASTCEYCGKISSTTASHLVHIRTHTGEKPYKCNVCDKRFAQTTLLIKHSLIHTGALPHECSLCGRKFRQQSHLSLHQLTHTGDKPHQCKFCQKTFALRGNLTVHLRLHTGETPYNCSSCDRQFHSSNDLKRHKKMHDISSL